MIFGGIRMKNKVSSIKPGSHALVRMRDPNIAHQVLNRCGHDQVQLCICCWNYEKVLCPHRGREIAGACPSYVLDEADVEKMEARMTRFLAQPHKTQQLLAA